MTGLAFAATEMALKSALQFQTGKAEISGKINGKKVANWTYRMFMGGAAVGVTVALVGFIFNNMLVVGLGVLVVSMGLLSAFTAKKMQVLKTYDAYNKDLAGSLTKMTSIAKTIKGENEKLKKTAKKFEDIPEDFGKVFEKGKKDIEEKSKQIADLEKKIKNIAEKLSKMSKVAGDIDLATTKLSREVLEFSKQNQSFGENEEQLEKQVDEIDGHKTELIENVDQFDESNEEFERINRDFSERIEMLENVFAIMKKMYVKTKSKMGELEAQVYEFQEAAKIANASTAKLRQLEEKFALVQSKIIEKLSEWSKIKQSEDYREFKKWKKEGGLRNDRGNRKR